MTGAIGESFRRLTTQYSREPLNAAVGVLFERLGNGNRPLVVNSIAIEAVETNAGQRD